METGMLAVVGTGATVKIKVGSRVFVGEGNVVVAALVGVVKSGKVQAERIDAREKITGKTNFLNIADSFLWNNPSQEIMDELNYKDAKIR
jgi:hypothetical protein